MSVGWKHDEPGVAKTPQVAALCPMTGKRVPTGLAFTRERWESDRPTSTQVAQMPARGRAHVWSKKDTLLTGAALRPGISGTCLTCLAKLSVERILMTHGPRTRRGPPSLTSDVTGW
jgi:hypothetical protein